MVNGILENQKKFYVPDGEKSDSTKIYERNLELNFPR